MKATHFRWLKRAWPLLLGLLLVITISYIGPDKIPMNVELATGKYKLETVLNDQKSMLRGPVYFEYSEKQSSPVEARIFKLHFVNPLVAEGPGFGFMIPLSGTDVMLREGEYSVDESSRGILKNFETVFGYADMGGKTSALFFSESGSITVTGCTPSEVFGEIDMMLDDGNGATIRITGDFNAQPLPSNINL